MSCSGTGTTLRFTRQWEKGYLAAMRKFSFVSTFLATCALALSAPASAQQQQQPQRPQAISQFDELTIRYLLADIQATYTVEQDSEGQATYRASAEGGFNFVLAPRACTQEQGCVGLVLIALFTDVRTPSGPALDSFINQYNDRYPTAKIMRNGQGMIALQSYINVAYGSSYRNVQAQLLVFGENISNLSRTLVAMENGG